MMGRRLSSDLSPWAHAACIVALCQVTILLPAASGSASTVDVQQQGTLSDSWGAITPEAEQLVSWMRKHGGEVNVVIRTLPNLGRKVFAPHDIKAGDVLAEIPTELCYRPRASNDDGEPQETTAAAAQLFMDMNNPSSLFQPYFKILPARDKVWSYYDIPESYLPLIHNEVLEDSIANLQIDIMDQLNRSASVNEGSRGADAGASQRQNLQPTADDLRYILSLMETRAFLDEGEDGHGSSTQLIPLLDMADHRNDCPNTYHEDACSSSRVSEGGPGSAAVKKCFIWVAEEDLAAGQEVCNNYRYLLQDMSLLQYGFLQEGPPAEQLSRLDRHDFKAEDPWEETTAVNQGGSPFEVDSADQCREELDRLKQLQRKLKASDESLKYSIKPHARDPGGWFLQQLWKWHAQRQAAIAAEVEKLGKLLIRFEEAERVLGLPKPQEVYDKLIAWMHEKGAQVNVAVKPRTTTDQQQCMAGAASGSCGSCAAGNQVSSNAQQDTTHSAVASCPQGGFETLQGVFANKEIKAGDIIAVIPVALTYPITGGAGDILEAAHEIMLDNYQQNRSKNEVDNGQTLHDNHSNKATFWEPYFATLPPLGSLKTIQNFPTEYLPLLHDVRLDVLVSEARSQTEQMWHERRPAVEAATNNSLVLADHEHMAAVVSSRVMALGAAGLRLVPLLDLAKHDNSCQHSTQVEECTLPSQVNSPDAADAAGSGAANSRCLIWKAGVDLASGEEVCSGHRGYLLPDVAFLQYGMLLPQQQQHGSGGAPELHGIDNSDVDFLQLFGGPGVVSEQQPTFSGTWDQAVSEAARLKVKLQRIASAEAQAAAAAVQPASEDWGGRLLHLLHAWRRQRVAALEAEFTRIIDLYGINDAGLAPEIAVIQQREAEAEAENENY